MNIIIAVALITIAGAMLFGRPLQITIVHKVDQGKPVPEPETQNPDQPQNATLDAALQVIQDFMGVKDDGDNT
jgi:hypothetical protein